MRIQKTTLLVAAAAFLSMVLFEGEPRGHSVAQVQTAKRISRSTVILLDPQGNPVPGGTGTDTTAEVGDILTFIFQFTPVPNNATRGAGGYITEYVPANTEVVGARIIDKNGNTVAPHRGPQMDDGWGPRGRHNGFDGMGLLQGSLAQLYADTGIFYSTDPRTARSPNDQFITVTNGLAVSPVPTGATQLDNFLGFTGPPFNGHNQWDVTQAVAYGANGGSVVSNGQGNTPFGYGSAVAGPDTHYRFEKVATPACSSAADDDGNGDGGTYPGDTGCASSLDDDETTANDGPVGPWKRIKYDGSEIGAGAATNCQSCQGSFVRVGVPTSAGWDLSPDNPLPSIANPDGNGRATNAVRYAVGELIVGEEYFAEISLRVLDTPLDPTMNADVNCSEVFGGDAAQPQTGQDNSWRYFVPSPACVELNNFFELSVDKLVAAPGETLTYKIEGKNLSVNPQTNVVVKATYVPGDVSFVSTVSGPTPTVANGTITWPTMNLAPGDEYLFEYTMDVDGGGLSTLHKANYTSSNLPSPGFTVVALTNIDTIVVGDIAMSVTPTSTTAGSTVRYKATYTNLGTGSATYNGASFMRATLPNDITYCGVSAGCTAPTVKTFNATGALTAGGNSADPTTVNGTGVRFYTFTNFGGTTTILPRGGRLELEFDAKVAPAVSGLYQANFQIQVRDGGVGRDVENFKDKLADLLVSVSRSQTPTLDTPIFAGATTVTGNTAEGPGASVIVTVNGASRPAVVAGAGGDFTVTVTTVYAGQGIRATAQAAGEVVSLPSAEEFVQGVNASIPCSDGNDNDGDGLIDFPEDPGCSSGTDLDEAQQPECSDGINNDGDGETDFPDDTSCSSYVDDDESGPPACGDGDDNDGDGETDFPDDPGCASATDVSEADLPQCANGDDDDSDGESDYPFDPGCSGPLDDDEGDVPLVGDDAGVGEPIDAGTNDDGGGNPGDPPDPGGVDGNGGGGGGCCSTGAPAASSWLLALGLAALLSRRSRPRRPRRSRPPR